MKYSCLGLNSSQFEDPGPIYVAEFRKTLYFTVFPDLVHYYVKYGSNLTHNGTVVYRKKFRIIFYYVAYPYTRYTTLHNTYFPILGLFLVFPNFPPNI